MKLSEAIRLGAMQFPQGGGGWMDGETRCALAAASEASGIKGIGVMDAYMRVRQSINYNAMEHRYPILTIRVEMPVFGIEVPLSGAIWRLNDYQSWTREQIADWVETIEAQHEQSHQPAEVTA